MPKRIGAVCKDGTITYATGRGAGSHHGGVQQWLYEGDSGLSSNKHTPSSYGGSSSFYDYMSSKPSYDYQTCNERNRTTNNLNRTTSSTSFNQLRRQQQNPRTFYDTFDEQSTRQETQKQLQKSMNVSQVSSISRKSNNSNNNNQTLLDLLQLNPQKKQEQPSFKKSQKSVFQMKKQQLSKSQLFKQNKNKKPSQVSSFNFKQPEKASIRKKQLKKKYKLEEAKNLKIIDLYEIQCRKKLTQLNQIQVLNKNQTLQIAKTYQNKLKQASDQSQIIGKNQKQEINKWKQEINKQMEVRAQKNLQFIQNFIRIKEKLN